MAKRMEDYLNISHAKDLKDPKEKTLYRLLEIFPGFLSCGSLLMIFFLSWVAPAVVAVFIIVFDLYWLLRIVYLSCHQVVCFNQMRKNLKIDWHDKISKMDGWKKIHHLIILPMYKEDIKTAESTLQALVNSDYPKEKFIVVLATEERAGQEIQKKIKELQKVFAKKFYKFLITVHPQNMNNELPGKGSNLAFALKVVKEEVIENLKIPPENIIVSNFDIDTRPYPQYFACLTFHYLTCPEPQKTSYQPIPVYNNNVWQASAFSRVVATSGTFWQMMQQERPEQLVTYSSHALSLKTLEEVSYPANVVSDDSRIFWKSYLYYDGNYKVVPLCYPVSMDAVLAKNLFRTIINQYKQQRRWAWGVENIPYLFFGFIKNKKISLFEKVRHLLNILDGFWSWATSSLMIFFLGWLPLMLGGDKFNVTLLSYNLPRLTKDLMTLAMIGMIISGALSFFLLPPKPKNFNSLKKFSVVLQWLLLPLTLIFFGAIPALDAQTKLMFGRYLDFWPTEKRFSNQNTELSTIYK